MTLAARGNYTIPHVGAPGYGVVKANFSATGTNQTFQYNWTINAHACGRPPADLDLPVVCIGMGYWTQGHIDSPGSDYTAFEQCCRGNTSAGTEIFTMSNACPSAWCFTDDTQQIPWSWGACYKNAVQDQIEKVRRQNSSKVDGWWMHPENTLTRCEYIDFEMLKKGVTNPKAAGSGAGARNGVMSTWVFLLGAVAVVVLSTGL